MALRMSMGVSTTVGRPHATPSALPRGHTQFAATPRRQSVRAKAEDEKQKGVAPGFNQWPPKAFTEHGDPKPEDDPKNYDVITGERKGGPSQAEVDKIKQKEADDLPFSKSNQPGGPQAGGGGEGSAS